MLELINESNSCIFDKISQDYEDEFSLLGEKEKSKWKVPYRRRLAQSEYWLLLERRLQDSRLFYYRVY